MSLPHRRHHPKWHRRRIPIFWWLGHSGYTKFITRELTSVFVAYTALLVMVQIHIVGRGEAAYAQFVAWLQSPVVIGAHVGVLLGLLFHSLTWLGLAPQALVIRIRGRRVPNAVVLLAHYGAWAAASAATVWGLVGR